MLFCLPPRQNERGSVLVYILIAIALLAALTLTFMEPSSQQTSSQGGLKTMTEIESQMNMIRSAIQECVLSYPRGDLTIDNTGTGTDIGARRNYPINPDSEHYTTATPGRSGDRLARKIRCPGNNPGGTDVEDHAMIFSGSSGKFLPAAPDLFTDWQYYNGPDGIYFWASSDKSDAFIESALLKLDEKYSECEFDVVDNRASATPLSLDSDGDTACPARSLCARSWLIVRTGAVYAGDVDGEETAEGCGT